MSPPDRFERYLLPSETRVLQLTFHWMFLAKPVGWFLAGLLVTGALLAASGGAGLAWLLFLAALVGFGLPVLAALENRASVRFIITDSRVVFVTGWLAKRYGMMSLTKITDLTIYEPVLGRIFGYGTLTVESAGQEQALKEVRYLPRPHQAWHIISDLLYVRGAARPGPPVPRPPALQPPALGPEPTRPSVGPG